MLPIILFDIWVCTYISIVYEISAPMNLALSPLLFRSSSILSLIYSVSNLYFRTYINLCIYVAAGCCIHVAAGCCVHAVRGHGLIQTCYYMLLFYADVGIPVVKGCCLRVAADFCIHAAGCRLLYPCCCYIHATTGCWFMLMLPAFCIYAAGCCLLYSCCCRLLLYRCCCRLPFVSMLLQGACCTLVPVASISNTRPYYSCCYPCCLRLYIPAILAVIPAV